MTFAFNIFKITLSGFLSEHLALTRFFFELDQIRTSVIQSESRQIDEVVTDIVNSDTCGDIAIVTGTRPKEAFWVGVTFVMAGLQSGDAFVVALVG